MQITVNTELHEISAEPARTLLHVLREELGLTEAKHGCGEGQCGACTVLVDGRPVFSCIKPVADVAGHEVVTLEGLAHDPLTTRLADAFASAQAFQCGYCTPGMLVGATALLRRLTEPNDDAIVEGMDGHICRCGAYPRIVRAMQSAAPDREGPPAAARAPSAQTLARPNRPWDHLDAGERDWFDMLGPGLIIVLTSEEMEKIEEKTGTGWSTPGGGWLHLTSTGTVTLFCGKVDVGQGNSTALRRLVAAEMGVPLHAVTVVMGDTDVTPYDLGTFGSRSMADAGTIARLLAATAREAVAADGLPAPGACDVRQATTDAPLRSDLTDRLANLAAESRAVGVRTRYTSDMATPGVRHGRVLRAPSLGAELALVDTSRAAEMPDVEVVHDGDFVGVTAPDPLTAQQAIESIQAEWQTTADPPTEAELETHLRGHPVNEEGWQGNLDRRRGDPERAFAQAARSFAATYRTAYIAHMPLETRAAVAEADTDGRLTVWTGTQRPFGVREEIAEALGIDESNVRVIVPPTGSGYGGKHASEAAVEAARLARATNRTIKVRWTRAEEFRWAYFRPAAVIDIRSAVDANGRVIAWEHVNINSGPNAIAAPYEFPNTRVAYQAAQSPLRQGSWRALAATANTFARESHIDELAHDLGVDSLDFRLRHLRDDRLGAVLRAAAQGIGWPVGRHVGGGGKVGVGIALGFEKDGRVAGAARVRVTNDDSEGVRVEKLVIAYDCGLIVDRDNLTNQVAGAAVMGLSQALFEEIHFADGVVTTDALSKYRVARFSDTPEIEVILLDRPTEPIAGAGETPLICIAPAIANAIFAASGRRLRSLPLLAGW